jgi:hypothetical protein
MAYHASVTCIARCLVYLMDTVNQDRWREVMQYVVKIMKEEQIGKRFNLRKAGKMEFYKLDEAKHFVELMRGQIGYQADIFVGVIIGMQTVYIPEHAFGMVVADLRTQAKTLEDAFKVNAKEITD